MFKKVEDIPFNLNPFDLDISYKHGTIPSELEKYIDGTFFIELVTIRYLARNISCFNNLSSPSRARALRSF